MNYIIQKSGNTNIEHPCKIDFASIRKTTNLLKIDFHKYESVQNNADHLMIAFRESLVRGYKLEGKEFNMNEEEIENLLCDNYGDFMLIFGEALFNLYLPSDDAKKKFLEKTLNIQLPELALNKE